MKLLIFGFFVGIFGQLIWVIIFWNNKLWIGHWFVALSGIVIAVLGAVSVFRKE